MTTCEEAGRKGGLSQSEKKRAASRRNGALARRAKAQPQAEVPAQIDSLDTLQKRGVQPTLFIRGGRKD